MPSGPDDLLLSILDICLPSSGMEIYGMKNGSCPRVFFSQNSCRIFEQSEWYATPDRGFAQNSATERKWFLNLLAVRFFGISAEWNKERECVSVDR